MRIDKGGRPTVMNKYVLTALEQAFSWDSTVDEACAHAGISRNTFYEYLKKNPEYEDKVDTLRQHPTLLARETVIKAIKTDANHAFKYLERKRRKEFGPNVDITSDGKALPTPIIPLVLSDENKES
jgi:hypothetical protein